MRTLVLALAKGYKALLRGSRRMRGISDEDQALKRLATGRTWDDFCDTLKAAGANVMSHGEADSLTRAEGYRYLSRLTRAGLEVFLEHADPRAPDLRRSVHETVKMGADNPDNVYLNAPIDGEYDYRITGTRGTVHMLNFSTQKGGYGKGGGLPPTGFLDATDLDVGPDGALDIIVSTTKKPGNWLPMEADSGLLMVRQTFLDRTLEQPAQLSIQRISGPTGATPLTSATVESGLMEAANLVAGASFLFSQWVRGFEKHPNALPQFDPDTSTAMGGDPKIAYYHGYWKLAPNEALIIEATPPECEHWNIQLNNLWMESLDYRNHTIHLNKHTAVSDTDGSVRVVVAHDDPGVPNWLTTAGHPQGTMCWRWIRAADHPEPNCRVVPIDTLNKATDTP